jgi:hypothetical protein
MRKAILVLVGLLLFGCGGGQSAPVTVSGVAATGSAVSGTVSLKDSYGHELSMVTADGTFSFDVSALTPPFMLKASWGGKTMYSFAATAGTANITPLTQMIVAAAANGGNLDAIYATPDKTTFAAVASNLPVATASLRANLQPLLASYSADMDPITGAFAANGNGMDSLLDHVMVTCVSGTVSVTDKTSGATLFTAPATPNLDHGVSAMTWTSQQANVAQDPDVQVSATGNGLAVWWQNNSDNSSSTIQAQWLNGSTPTQISTATGFATSPRVAFDASGNAIAVWAQSDNQLNNVWVNRYTVGSGWGTPLKITNVSSTATSVSGGPTIGVDGAGNAIITWYQENGAINSDHFDVYTSRYSVTTNRWSAPAMLSNGTNSAYLCKVVVNPAGAAALIWVQDQDDGSVGNGEPSDVWVITGNTTGGWGGAVKVNIRSNSIYGQATVAIDATGDVLAAWVQSNSSGLFDIWVNHLTAGGNWGGATTISAGNIGECYGPDIAFDGDGNAFAVWEQQSDADSRQYIAASQYTIGAGWSAPVQVNENLGNAFDQHVAVDASGNATVVWYQLEQSAVTVRSSRYLQASGWGASQLLATMDSTYDGYTLLPVPRVGVNAGGQSFVVWGTGSN